MPLARLLLALQLLAAVTSAAPATWRVAERDGRAHLVTPDGRPFVVLGLSHASLALAETTAAPLAPEERAQREAQVLADLRASGFNTLALGFDTWGQPIADPAAWEGVSTRFARRMQPELPFIAGMDRFVGDEALPAFGSKDAAARFEDVFDPEFKRRLRAKVERLCALTRDSPNCIGYWWSDIPPWNFDAARTRFGRTWLDVIRALPESAPGRRRHAEFLRGPPPHDDTAFLGVIARELYADLAEAFRAHAPGRLLFGERYLGFNTPEPVLAAAARHVDVISVQPYEGVVSREKFDEIHRLTGKPILISDWNLSFPTPQHRVTMWPQFKTPAETAAAYENYVRAAFATPYLLGYYKCQYVDQPLATGMLKQGLRTPDGDLREEFATALAGIHARLAAQLAREGRLPPAQDTRP
jgi:hypothetical protein